VRRLIPLLVAVAAGVFAASAGASITLATNAHRPALRVDAAGNAEISWSQGGARRYVYVPARGRFLPGRRLSGADVSRPATDLRLPYQEVLRRTPDGRRWALQSWRVAFAPAVELRFSRWRGAPTAITLEATPSRSTEILRGRATFAGRPVTGYSPTNAGTPILLSAFFDCAGCGAVGWARFGAKRTAANGTFALTVPLPRRGKTYRVSIAGPNRGATLAPDASATSPSSL
jgi:hypothetical protein